MKNTATIKLLKSMSGNEGEKIALFYNGKLIRRRVYYRSWCGLFIIVEGRMFFEYELIQGEEKTFSFDSETDKKEILPSRIILR